MSRFLCNFCLTAALIAGGVDLTAAVARDGILALHTRSRSDEGALDRVVYWRTSQTAIIVCDMWDQNWCKGANERVVAREV